MPGPCALAIPLALAATGAGLSAAANTQSERAMERRVRQELARQSQFQQRAGAAYQESAKQATPEVAAQQLGAGAAGRQAGYEAAQQIPLSVSTAAPATTPTQQLSTQATVGASNVARAQNAAYDDWLLQQLIKNMRAQQELGVTSGLARGSQAVLPYELQQAQHAGDPLRNLGSLASLAGSIYGLSSLVSAPATAAPAATNICGP